ncbi:MAG: T9SS type A sorting domain-containing protein [Saprospiraceae bacterium]|nr:T9SS type A sorting domain-containing protein [Saprospiraceae bacterium]
MKNTILFSIAIFGFSFSNFAQNRLYVNSSATGANNGQSWADAFTDLNTALTTAQSGDSVWVAMGVFIPTTGSDRTSSFVQKSGVRLYGGFEGTETSLGQREWFNNPTVLSGDIGTPGDSTDNAYTILYMNNPDSMTVVDGFVFRHGIANYTPTDLPAVSAYKCGGALYIMAADSWAYPLIQNCHFERNYAYSHGGAVYVNGSGAGSVAPQFINCSFENNRARLDGGALYRNGGSWVERSPDFGNCLFKNNVSERRGGGLCYNESERTDWIDLHGCTFLNNRSNLSGGGANFNVGRVTGTNISMKDCRFEGNGNDVGTAQGEAFALASITLLDMGTLIIDSCSFIENDPGLVFLADILGGEFSMIKSFTKAFNNAQAYNTADFIKCKIKECILFSNQNSTLFILGKSTLFSENIIVAYDQSTILAFFSNNTVAEILNNVIVHRAKPNTTFSAGNNDHIKLIGNTVIGSNWLFQSTNAQKIEFSNSIFQDWNFVIPSSSNSPITFDNCLFKNNSFCLSPPSNVTCGPNNLFNLDPLFRDTTNLDYSLLPCSPLINAGSNAAASGILTDLAGNPRIQGGTVDIGAYESPAFALAAEPLVHPACIGASNGSISLSPVFGCEPYTYNWSPQAGNGPELNGLPPGNFIFTITDGSGRQILDTVVVASAPQPSLALASTDVQCGNTAGGSLSASVASGTAAFQYTWLPVAADTALLLQQQPGDYALTVVDANGCQDSASASIALLGMLTPMIGGQTISCFGVADGWLSLTPATGAAPFQWQWEGWPGTDSIAQPLGPGNYSVTVTDAFGCTASNTFPAMTQPGLLVVGTGSSAQTQTSPPNGAAVVTTISGGTSPFYFEWDEGSTTQAIAGLNAGTYTVTVTDENGCAAVAEVVVEQMISSTEEAAGLALMIYPNPAADWVKIVFYEVPEACQVELSDASGRVLQRVSLSSAIMTLDLRGLPSGNYVATVREGTGPGTRIFVGKVVKH